MDWILRLSPALTIDSSILPWLLLFLPAALDPAAGQSLGQCHLSAARSRVGRSILVHRGSGTLLCLQS